MPTLLSLQSDDYHTCLVFLLKHCIFLYIAYSPANFCLTMLPWCVDETTYIELEFEMVQKDPQPTEFHEWRGNDVG